MKSKKIPFASNHEKEKHEHYLADGEEAIVIFGIGEKYFWYTFISYLAIVFFLLFYPLILRMLPGLEVINDYGYWIFAPGVIIGLIGFPYIMRLIHEKHSITYIFTDRRVLIKEGILSVNWTSAPYDKISHITIKEDFLKKISYQIGDITIHTAGPTPIETDLFKVQQPVKVKNLLEELIVRERTLLGVMTDEEPIIKPLR